jgi:hypothetical protein
VRVRFVLTHARIAAQARRGKRYQTTQPGTPRVAVIGRRGARVPEPALAWPVRSLMEIVPDGEAARDRAQALAAVRDGAAVYFALARGRVSPFVDAHFSWRGTLSLHRAALGWDVLKAPLNVSLALPQIALHAGAFLARSAGAARLAATLHRTILLRTAVSREIEWLIHTELLQLPFAQGARAGQRDALSEAILAQPTVQAALAEIGRHGEDPAFRARLRKAMDEYGISRSAAAEITTGLLNLSAGALAVNKLTPGAATLGPAIAGLVAHQSAVGAFPLGAWAGAAWYGFFPVIPSAGLVGAATGGLVVGSAMFAAFAGVVFDPIQKALGLHRRRLLRMIDGLERQFNDPEAAGFSVRDQYVARLLDVFDILGAAVRVVGV